MEKNLFEEASRQKVRFTTPVGELTVEQLWDLPLQSKRGLDLDTVAKACNAGLKAVTEESFVATSTNPKKSEFQLKLDIAKHIIAVKIAENAEKESKAAKQTEKQKLLAALENRKEAELSGLSKEEIEERIKALD